MTKQFGQYLTSGYPFKSHWRAACLSLCLLVFTASAFAQYSAQFDSAYRAAVSATDPAARLTRLRPLIEQSYECSVFQTISFGKAFLQAATQVRRDTDLYQAHTILCTGYERNRDFEQSISNGLQAVSIAGRLKDYLKQIRAFQDVAFAYSSMGMMSGNSADVAKAFYYCDQALKVSKAQNIKTEEPFILTMTADVSAMNKKYDTAVGLYHRAIQSRKEQGLAGTVTMYMNLGIALDLQKNYDAALAAYAMADSLCSRQHKGAFIKLKIASNRAILYGSMGKVHESEILARQVLTDAQLTGAMDVQVDMVDHLKKLSQQQEQYLEALTYADTLAAIKERMLNEEKTGQVAEMQARYEAGVKDQQIVGQQLTIAQDKRQNMMLWCGILLLFFAGTGAYVGWRRSRELNRKITAQQTQLLTQKTELERVNEMKDQIFSVIGHDVRVPLNSMMAYAALLDHHVDLPSEKVKQYNTDLRQTLSYTTVLMENMLQFAKVQMQAAKAYPENISLKMIVEAAALLLKPAMDQKKISLQVAFDDNTNAFADEDMAEVIVRNLLSNAIKFSETGGNIYISVNADDDEHICCKIKDEGTGMKPELVAFWNDSASTTPIRSTMGTQQEKGSGLGLMLSKTFTILLGGRLIVKSEEGKGAECSLILPRQKLIV